MDGFLKKTRAAAEVNPELRQLKGLAEWDRGKVFFDADDSVSALKAYDKALEGGPAWNILYSRGLQDFGRVVDLFGPRHVGHVDESIQAVLDLDEGAESRQVADLAGDLGAHGNFILDARPRIGSRLLESEADLLVLGVQLEHDGFHFVALVEELRGMLDMLGPGFQKLPSKKRKNEPARKITLAY